MTSIKFRALTHADHKLFFEAIGEYGKDFQNIQQYMTQKCGKPSLKTSEQNKSNSVDQQERKEQDKKDEDKKREQIRNFYNKLYGKLSQLIGKLDDRIEKVVQELYLLINYGEIWKKHGFKFNNKTKKLLEELVYQGYTSLRFKNKNVRLRTPSCKALKKINKIGVDEKDKVVTTRELPKDIIVEFHPATNYDWLRVQSISQNPRARARLSIQKRISSLLEFLENKWNISQDKLNRTVNTWLKVSPNNQMLEDVAQQQHNQQQQRQHQNQAALNGNSIEPHMAGSTLSSEPAATTSNLDRLASLPETRFRLRLRPSAKHELNEVNITRVVPDSHLDLSLNAYISRLGGTIAKPNQIAESHNKTTALKTSTSSSTTVPVKDTAPSTSSLNNPPNNNIEDFMDYSSNPMLSSSRLSASLTTPDSSILLERSMTSEQPSIAQTRRHLNILQSIAGSFEGCENSRTAACDDTQDRHTILTRHHNVPSLGGGDMNRISGADTRVVSFSFPKSDDPSSTTQQTPFPGNISAILDEDAIIETALPNRTPQEGLQTTSISQSVSSSQALFDNHNSRSVDFQIPKNITLGEWFNRNEETGCEEANDAFPSVQDTGSKQTVGAEIADNIENTNGPTEETATTHAEACDNKTETKSELTINENNLPLKSHDHMIEVDKLVGGWTRQDDTSMTIGKLYLAFKCPEKIILEYEFEQYNKVAMDGYQQAATPVTAPNPERMPEIRKDDAAIQITKVCNSNKIANDTSSSNNALLFKLLTAASLSLAQIERQKQEQLMRLREPPNAKIKRRKGPTNSNTIKYLKRDETLQSSSTSKILAGFRPEGAGSGLNQTNDNNNYLGNNNDKIQAQILSMSLHDIETRNQRVEEALKQLQPTRLSVYRRAR